MPYTAFYRKFRPDTFRDVKGQDAIVTTLKNQIMENRIGHAYLFCGTRGTGKTTVAKIFARSVNCEHPVDGSPCGECPVCRAIASGSSLNVSEIDAASNNNVDNIRRIVEDVSYPPTEGKYKVYIIDEAHMLSLSAFNALLKTLEEPPSYVIFILATTEVHKIPVTILSRCQRYDFRRISVEQITARLRELTEVEKIRADEAALSYIAKMADGALRDALSLLDQCVSLYQGQELTYEKVLDALGTADTEVFSRLLRLILAHDVSGCLSLLEEVTLQGRELSQFVADFTWYLRNLLLAGISGDMAEAIDLSGDNLKRLVEEAGMTDSDTVMRYIRIFSELSSQIRFSTQKRVLLEVALVKLCRPQMETEQDALLERLRQLEQKVERMTDAAVPAQPPAGPTNARTALPEQPAQPPAGPMDAQAALPEQPAKPAVDSVGTADSTPAQPENSAIDAADTPLALAALLEDVTKAARQPMKTHLKRGRLSRDDDGSLTLFLPDGTASDFFLRNPEREQHRAELKRLLNERAQRDEDVRILPTQVKREADAPMPDLSNRINMEIEIED